ncbi:MAG: putative addiction module antidote protein [Desulforudis sp.]|jgi:probable addiction module antidote protein|nr:MAG: putative addiction module antidote protein [Desulforudis sp.]
MREMTRYENDLNEWLKDSDNAAEYLTASIEEGDKDSVLLALRRVALAQGGMASVAQKAQVPRESLYRALSQRGNPALTSLLSILHGMGLRMTIQPEK